MRLSAGGTSASPGSGSSPAIPASDRIRPGACPPPDTMPHSPTHAHPHRPGHRNGQNRNATGSLAVRDSGQSITTGRGCRPEAEKALVVPAHMIANDITVLRRAHAAAVL